MVIQVGIDVDEVKVFEPLLGGRRQFDQATHGLGIDQPLVLRGIGHVGQSEPGDQVGAVQMVAGRDLRHPRGRVADADEADGGR